MAVTPGALSAFGIGRETTPGTAATATFFPPFASFTGTDAPEQLVDEGYRGSMGSQYGAVLGPTAANIEFEGPGFMDSLGALLHNILGDYAVGTAVEDVYPHTFSLLNSAASKGQPPTHTFVDSQQLTASVGARVYPHTCLAELQLTGNVEGLFEVTGSGQSFPSEVAGAAMTNTPTAEQVVPSWRSTVSLGGSALESVTEWQLTISRELQVVHTADGTNAPYTIGRGPVTVQGSLTLVALDETPLTGFLANTQSALVITVNNGGTTSAERELTLTVSKMARSETSMTRETLLGYEVSFIGLMNVTDAGASGGYSPIKAVLNNAVATYAA